MGGQTARLLAHLLRHGDPDEQRESGADCHDLFKPGTQWVQSITTISTPHNGTTLVNDIDLIDKIIHSVIIGMTTAIESALFPDFDLKMSQWGINRNPDEQLSSYFFRLRKHRIWSGTERDFSLWDTSIEGAAALNRKAPADPDIYYFSISNEKTATGPVKAHQIPEIGMLAPLIPGGIFLGSYIEHGVYTTDTSWWPNDGVVNTYSMQGPILGSSDSIVDFDGTPTPGVWNHMGVLTSMDHGDVIGVPSAKGISPEGYDSLVEFYLQICETVSALPR
jgi:triacylglycerol lipase